MATKNDIDRLELKLEGKMDKLTWMMGALIVLAAANFAKQFF